MEYYLTRFPTAEGVFCAVVSSEQVLGVVYQDDDWLWRYESFGASGVTSFTNWQSLISALHRRYPGLSDMTGL